MKNDKKIFICSNCGRGSTLPYGMCPWPDCKAIDAYKKQTDDKPIFDTEVKLFFHVNATRPHISEISGKSLDKIPTHLWFNTFAHILPKGKYKNFRLMPENIMRVTPEEHQLIDQGTIQQREKYEKENNCSFDLFFIKQEELKKQYK